MNITKTVTLLLVGILNICTFAQFDSTAEFA